MAGPKQRPAVGGADPLIVEASAAPETTTLPDPAPYQSRRPLTLRANGETTTYEEVYWTKRKLREWLAACPRVQVTVPRDPNNDPADPQARCVLPVYYDGFRFEVPKGNPVEVPAPIGWIVQQGQQQYRTAQSQGIDLYLINERNPDGAFIDPAALGV